MGKLGHPSLRRFLVRPRSCRALSACLPPCFARALVLRPLLPSALPPVRRPLTPPPSRRPPPPFSACSLARGTSSTRARFLCAPHGFFCALCAVGILLWPVCLAYDLSITLDHTLLCAAWLFLQRRLCAHLPHWRVLCWRLCAECFVLPCDGLHCRWTERAAAMLLECVHAGWKRCRWERQWYRHRSVF